MNNERKSFLALQVFLICDRTPCDEFNNEMKIKQQKTTRELGKESNWPFSPLHSVVGRK